MVSVMSDSINSLPSQATQPDQTDRRQSSDRNGKGLTSSVSELSPVQQQKASLNVSILETAAVIIGVKDDPLALVLSSAVERINEFLAPTLGDNAIQKGADSELDVSPEATAERIASLSTSFFNAFKEQHPGESESVVLTNFIETISSGIETGFDEARDILEGLDVLAGDTASNIDQTFDLVNEKLAAFESMINDMNSFLDSSGNDAEPLEEMS